MKITKLSAYEIIDSRGIPTVSCALELSSGGLVCASVPSGASTGLHEAFELRDGDQARFLGKGVLKALDNINTVLAPLLLGEALDDIARLDLIMLDADGTSNKSKLGANAILAVSMAMLRGCALAANKPLYRYLHAGDGDIVMPVPFMNVINGGCHADNNIDIQEFMIVPYGFDSFAMAMRAGVEVFTHLKILLKEMGLAVAVGDEGGFAPDLSGDRHALDLLMQAIDRAGYVPGKQIGIALDVAATELYVDGVYNFAGTAHSYSAEDWAAYCEDLVASYPIISIEDAMSEDDWLGWQCISEVLGDKILLVGDDVFVTQIDRLKIGIAKQAANTILIKPNQVGSMSETCATISFAKQNSYSTMISHRSGETEDSFIADLAVGVAAGMIKTGAPSRSERTAKYNRLLCIEAANIGNISYAGDDILLKSSSLNGAY